MKPLEPTPPVAGNPQKQEPSEQLADALAQQRLWQLLYALPELNPATMCEPAQVHGTQTAAVASSTGGTSGAQAHARDRDPREPDATSALSAAAHLLATSIQQLGLTRYGAEAAAEAAQARVARDLPWTMHVGAVDANGGNAALQVLHPLLGDIALDVELAQGSVKVIATVATEYGARILLEGQAVLAERLLLQGMNLASLDVLVRRKRRKTAQPGRKRPQREEP